jgi:hypothetical protein
MYEIEKLLTHCRILLKELQYLAEFYLPQEDPFKAFRMALSNDLSNFMPGNSMEDIPTLTLIAKRCEDAVTAARTRYLADHKVIVDQSQQNTLRENFHQFWKMLSFMDDTESNALISKLHRDISRFHALEKLMLIRLRIIGNISSMQSWLQQNAAHAASRFNFVYVTWMQMQLKSAEKLLGRYNERIALRCGQLVPPCLAMFQLVTKHAHSRNELAVTVSAENPIFA